MKMTDEEFERWCDVLNLTREAREEIARIRTSEPARLTDSGPYNVSGIFNRSWKMGHSIQFESHEVEMQAVLLYEDPNNDVIEYWEQPNTFTVRFIDKKGKPRGHKCTPDFFVLNYNSGGWEEWKTEERLLKLASDYPERYFQDENGDWHYVLGEEYAKRFGFYFRVRSSAEINYVLARNTSITHRFYKPGYVSVVDNDTIEYISGFLNKRPQATLSSLLEFAEEKNVSSGCIYELIATKRIYVNINRDLLTDPERTRVYLTKDDAAFYEGLTPSVQRAGKPCRAADIIPGTKAFFDGKPVKILLVGSTLVSLDIGGDRTLELPFSKFESYVERGLVTDLETRPQNPLDDGASEYAARFDRNDRTVALERYRYILPRLQGKEVINPPVSMRTIRGWVKRFREGKEKYGDGILGLIPLHKMKGPRGPKLLAEVRRDMNQCIEETYETVVAKNINVSYGEFERRCKMKGIPEGQIPAYSTYRNEILTRAGKEQEEKRKGSRAAYQHEEFYWELDERSPRHGERPWQICHIDHTPLDILLTDWKTFKVLGIPTLTLLIDAFTRMILAFYLSFDRESKKSLMMVLRDCVRRHKRLPELVVVDKGAAFRSVYFDSVLARYNCDKKLRPTAKPRFGSLIERMFRTTNTQFIHNLMGNTKIWNDRRKMTKIVNPKNLALWNYGLLYDGLDRYFRSYNSREHPALDGLSPQEAYNVGMKQYDLPYDEIVYDRNFLIETMPETPRGKGEIVRNRGIKFHYIFYNSPRLQQEKLIGTSHETRFDPFDASSIWAYVNGRWEEAYAPPSLYNLLKKCSERDIAQMSEVLRQRRRRHAGGYALRAEDIAEHLAHANEDEERELQRKLDIEGFARSSGSGFITRGDAQDHADLASTGMGGQRVKRENLVVFDRIRRSK